MAVNYVGTYLDAINVQPDRELVKNGGVSWVRIHGGGVREGYLVEQY